jgi:hypothetical protein
MTTSVVAVVTDHVVDGCPVVGFGFNSNGRYAAQVGGGRTAILHCQLQPSIGNSRCETEPSGAE